MSPIGPLVAGFDGSSRSEDAIELASLLGELLSVPLFAVCAWTRPALSGPDDALTKVLREEAERIAGQAARMARVPVEEALAVEEAPAPRALARVAAERAAGLVVVGSSHRGALGRVLVGSVPERLLHDGENAVAVAPAGFVTGEPPRLRSVGVGFDGGPESYPALALGVVLARAARVPLRVIGVVGTRLAGLVPAALSSMPHAAHLVAIEEREREAVRATVAQLRDIEVIAEPRFGEPVSSLTARSRELSLLVLGSHAYGGLRRLLHGSVSTELTRASACPLIVIPPASRLARAARAGELARHAGDPFDGSAHRVAEHASPTHPGP